MPYETWPEFYLTRLLWLRSYHALALPAFVRVVVRVMKLLCSTLAFVERKYGVTCLILMVVVPFFLPVVI